jgi:hypothetical protein
VLMPRFKGGGGDEKSQELNAKAHGRFLSPE